MDFQDKNWYFYLIKTKTLIRDEDLIYIGITTNPENRYYDHMGSGSTNILKNFTKGVLEYNVFDIKLEKMRRQYAENLETLLACILKYNYPNLKIYGGCFNRIDCDITNDKIIEKFRDVFKGKYDAIFYKHFNEFIKIVIGKNIKIGNNVLNLTIPTEYESDGDIKMWNT